MVKNNSYTNTNDLLGRRISKNEEQYGYNVRDELISADDVSYNYDDIGNRTTAEGKTYTANNLNQYTAIDDFAPQYDDDGNQTLIKTETGIWSVVYNAENRPIRWQSGDTVITMAFDRMGRRVEMRTVKDGAETLQRFAYDNYLCVQQLRGADNAIFHSYVWDPTEPIATRPLIFIPSIGEVAYYFHDGNKNVSDLVDIQGSVVHYAYTPFGAPTASVPAENPYRFSAEVYDGTLGLSYYNYRHHNSRVGRWLTRDLIEEYHSIGLYLFAQNNGANHFDRLGLMESDFIQPFTGYSSECQIKGQTRTITTGKSRMLSSKYTGKFKTRTFFIGKLFISMCLCELEITTQVEKITQTCSEEGFCLLNTTTGATFTRQYVWKTTSSSWEMHYQMEWKDEGISTAELTDIDGLAFFITLFSNTADNSNRCQDKCDLLRYRGR